MTRIASQLKYSTAIRCLREEGTRRAPNSKPRIWAAMRAATVALSTRGRQAITKEMAQRHGRASKRERGRGLMLDEFCALGGYNLP